MNHRIDLRGIFAVGFGLLLSVAAQAQAFRTYLSGAGNDSNPCTLAAPCRLLPAAITAVIDGGEIWILDSANYNIAPVTVNKSVTILVPCPAHWAALWPWAATPSTSPRPASRWRCATS